MSNVQNACVIIIGNEILSGRTQDVNISFIGQRLDKLGILLSEARIIPDEEKIIIDTINETRKKYSYVFTTGGIGPTHDDITSLSVSKAFNRPLVRNPHAVDRLQKYYASDDLSEARLRMADIPEGASLIENPVSGAPGYQVENVFILAGIPAIMREMFEGITSRLVGGDPVLSAWVATNLRESTLAGGLAGLQNKFPEIPIGSYPFFRNRRPGVNVVMRSTDRNRLEQVCQDLESLITGLNGKILELSKPE